MSRAGGVDWASAQMPAPFDGRPTSAPAQAPAHVPRARAAGARVAKQQPTWSSKQPYSPPSPPSHSPRHPLIEAHASATPPHIVSHKQAQATNSPAALPARPTTTEQPVRQSSRAADTPHDPSKQRTLSPRHAAVTDVARAHLEEKLARKTSRASAPVPASVDGRPTSAPKRAPTHVPRVGTADARAAKRQPTWSSEQSYGPSHSPRQPLSEAHIVSHKQAPARPTAEQSVRQSSRAADTPHDPSKQRTSSPTTPRPAAATEKLARKTSRARRAREPMAGYAAHDSVRSAPQRREPPVHSQPQHDRARSKPTEARSTLPPHAKKERIYCGNNKKARELLDGSERVGRPSECIQKGFGSALHQPVHDVAAFLRKFDGPYEKLIDPHLWYKNSEPPPGMQRCTLPMAFQKGWGAGTAALARKLREGHGRSGDAGSQ